MTALCQVVARADCSVQVCPARSGHRPARRWRPSHTLGRVLLLVLAALALPAPTLRGVARPQGPRCDLGAYEHKWLLAQHLAGGSLRLAGTGEAGKPCVLEESLDLVHWHSVQTATAGSNGWATFPIILPQPGALRFFRVVSP